MADQLELPGTEAKMHRCGRRGHWDPKSPFVGEEQQFMDQYRADSTCSYCGSLSGDAFIKFLRDGGQVGPTDKNYKAYLHDAEVAPGVVVRAPALKFYFQHLDAGQRAEFITLYNDRKMNIGYPGHFYVHPYFCGPAGTGG